MSYFLRIPVLTFWPSAYLLGVHSYSWTLYSTKLHLGEVAVTVISRFDWALKRVPWWVWGTFSSTLILLNLRFSSTVAGLFWTWRKEVGVLAGRLSVSKASKAADSLISWSVSCFQYFWNLCSCVVWTAWACGTNFEFNELIDFWILCLLSRWINYL